MNKRVGCTACIYRRAIANVTPSYSVCHYLLDTGRARGCPPEQCMRWQSRAQTAEQWVHLPELIKEADLLGE